MAVPSSVNARLFYRVANQRFEDAEFLLIAQRTTAAVYLAGYSVECILKAMVLNSVPQYQEENILVEIRGARAHDYGWLRWLYFDHGGPNLPATLVPHFARVNTWSTDMRYVPGAISFRDARAFVDSAENILAWGDGRLT